MRHDSEWSISGFGLCRDRRFRDCISLSGSVSETTYRCEGIFPEQWAERESSYVSVRSSDKLNAYRFGLQSFYEEAKMMAKFLNTPHIVTIYDVFPEMILPIW